MRLVCDEMLGRLARWLRLLGHDVHYVQHVEDEALLRGALAEDRLLLTRDAGLVARAPPGKALFVQALDPEQQLREVAKALGLSPDPSLLLNRCSLCNTPLEAASRAEAEASGGVPPAVLASHDTYWRCPGCGKLYWRGTHVERIEATLRALREGQP